MLYKLLNHIIKILIELNLNKLYILVSSDEEKTNENGQDNVINANLAFIKDTFIQYNRIDPNKNFDNFIVGSSNSLACEASKKVTESTSSYNPLYLYSGVGMGKTHLLNAIGLKLKSSKKVMFISAERFMYHFVKSIKSNEMMASMLISLHNIYFYQQFMREIQKNIKNGTFRSFYKKYINFFD